MLKNLFSSLFFDPLPLVSAHATASAAPMVQDPGMLDANDRSDGDPIPGLMYRRETVSRFFCIHD